MSDVTGYDLEDLVDLPTMIDKLIEKQVREINTCFIAKVTEVKENKVSVINSNQFMFKDKAHKHPIINDCLVAIPQGQNLKITMPLKVGDYGICVVLQEDYSQYKKSGKDSIPNTPRKFDLSDSVFIPFSLFETQEIKEDFEIAYTEGAKIKLNKDTLDLSSQKDSKIEIKENLEIKAKSFTLESSEALEIKNSQGSLLKVCEHLISMMDLLASGMKGGGTEPSAYNGGKQAFLQQIKGILK